jgi:hypothetical protein
LFEPALYLIDLIPDKIPEYVHIQVRYTFIRDRKAIVYLGDISKTRYRIAHFLPINPLLAGPAKG